MSIHILWDKYSTSQSMQQCDKGFVELLLLHSDVYDEDDAGGRDGIFTFYG